MGNYRLRHAAEEPPGDSRVSVRTDDDHISCPFFSVVQYRRSGVTFGDCRFHGQAGRAKFRSYRSHQLFRVLPRVDVSGQFRQHPWKIADRRHHANDWNRVKHPYLRVFRPGPAGNRIDRILRVRRSVYS